MANPRLEQTEGIAQTFVMGGRDPVVRVDISRARLDAYRLSFAEIAEALREQNIDMNAGKLLEGERDYLVRTNGAFRSRDGVATAVVSERGGRVVRLQHLGQVSSGYRREQNRVYIDGELPGGVRHAFISDTTEIIRNSLATVSGQAAAGAVLAVLVLFVFLRSVRSTLVVAVSIPASVLITLAVMYFAGFPLNLMTLAGLVLAVGLLVDSSIVILESIYRHRQRGTKLRTAAFMGTREMVGAITAATLTTVSVFLPLVMFRRQLELAGELFASLAFTVVISLLASLVVAAFLVPVLAARFFPLISTRQRPLRSRPARLNALVAAGFARLETACTRSHR